MKDLLENILMSNEKYEIYKPNNVVDSFQLFAENSSIEIYPSTTDEFTIYFKKGVGDEVKLQEHNGCFIFRHQMPSGFLFNHAFSREKRKVIVGVPKGNIKEFQAATINKTITIREVTGFKKGILSTRNAKIISSDLQGEDLVCDTTNAAIKVKDCNFTSLASNTENGEIISDNCRVSDNIYLRTINGKIEIQKLEAPKIWLQTKNAMIEGTIYGNIKEYSLDSATSNGSCNIPNWKDERCSKQLYVHTSNASIDVEFVSV